MSKQEKKDKNEPDFKREVFRQIFSRVDEMPENIRGAYDERMQGRDDVFRCLYILSQMPDSMYYYLLGIVSLEDADEISRFAMKLFMARAQEKLKMLNPNEMSREQRRIYEYFLHEIDEKTYCVDAMGSMTALEIPVEEIKRMYPSVKETITDMLNTDFDKYLPMALHFKPTYFDAVDYFQNLCELMVTGEQGAPCLDLNDRLQVCPCVVTGNKQATALARLRLIGDILSFISQEGKITEQFVKTKCYWTEMIGYHYRGALKKLTRLPQNERYPEINLQLKRMSHVLSRLSDCAVSSKQEPVLMSYLLVNARKALLEGARTDQDKLYRSLWYDKSVGFTANMEKNVEKYPTYDCDVSGLALLFHVFQNREGKLPEADDNESVQARITPYEEALVHLNYLKRLYYGKEEQRIPEINQAVFGAMRDHEILYLMGVLSRDDYQWCCHANEIIQYDEGQQAIREADISEIFMMLMDQEPSVILPLKKEYIDAMKQIRLAGSLYERAYLDDCAFKRIDLSKEKPFGNVCDFCENPLRGEGLMLEDLILLMHDVARKPVETSQILKRILKSYWRETTDVLNRLPRYERKEALDMPMRISENKRLFGCAELDSNETVAARFKNYRKLFQEIQWGILVKYNDSPSLRLAALNRFNEYVKPFREMRSSLTCIQKRNMVLKRENNQKLKDS